MSLQNLKNRILLIGEGALMKIIYLFWSLVLLLFSCKEDLPDPIVPEPEVADRNIIAYIMGQNSLSSFIDDDVREMKRAVESGALGSNNRLLVYIDDYSAPRLLRLHRDTSTGKAVCDTIKRYEEQLSVDPAVMQNVFSTVFEKYPADSYGLVLWSHGEGWLPDFTPKSRWIGTDNGNSGPKMNISELVSVLKQFPMFEFIFFDACFMESVEVAYELREYTKYMIGSVTETPGTGAPYQLMIAPMCENPCNIEKMIGDYYTYYSTTASSFEWTYGAAISAIDCSELSSLAQETRKVLSSHATYLDNPDLSAVQKYGVREVAPNVYAPCYYDLNGFIKSFATDQEYGEWKQQLDKCVPESYRKSTPSCYANKGTLIIDLEQYSGVSTYVMRPGSTYSKYNTYYKDLSWYTAAGWNQTNWGAE